MSCDDITEYGDADKKIIGVKLINVWNGIQSFYVYVVYYEPEIL